MDSQPAEAFPVTVWFRQGTSGHRLAAYLDRKWRRWGNNVLFVDVSCLNHQTVRV